MLSGVEQRSFRPLTRSPDGVVKTEDAPSLQEMMGNRIRQWVKKMKQDLTQDEKSTSPPL